jgi:putative membrane protein insertion efficiency factor
VSLSQTFTRRRLLATLVLVLSTAVCVFDASRPPSAQLSTRAALRIVHLYQRTISPLMPRLGVRCRFTPTCSHYAQAVFGARGFPMGALLTLRRIARCGPWTKDGTIDPPPVTRNSRTAQARERWGE